MAARLVSLAIVALLIVGVSASDVVVLTPDTFDGTVGKGNWMIEFYAPWCGHCKRLAPVWEEVATEAVKESAPFKFANIDCDAHKDFCAKFAVRGFPTIKYFHEGKTVYNYPPTTERSKENLLNFPKTGYLKEEGKPTPYDLARGSSSGAASTNKGASKAKAQGFLAEIEDALPSQAQKAVDWMRNHVELACLLASAIASFFGYVLGRLTVPTWTPNPPVNPPASAPTAKPAAQPHVQTQTQHSAPSPADSGSESTQKRKNAKK